MQLIYQHPYRYRYDDRDILHTLGKQPIISYVALDGVSRYDKFSPAAELPFAAELAGRLWRPRWAGLCKDVQWYI